GCGNKTTHQLRVSTYINRVDGDHGHIAARILAHREIAGSLSARQQYQQADNDGHHRPLDKNIRKFHKNSALLNIPLEVSASGFTSAGIWDAINCPPVWVPD